MEWSLQHSSSRTKQQMQAVFDVGGVLVAGKHAHILADSGVHSCSAQPRTTVHPVMVPGCGSSMQQQVCQG